MLGSFTDAPGGIEEELNEVIVSYGMEYWYKNKYVARGGYFWESASKGNRKYFTMGLGVKLGVFGLDLSYLIPQEANQPLSNTYGFSLLFNFVNKSKEGIE